MNQSIALWYPVFEEREFEVEVELEQTTWVVDDNQFSRVVRQCVSKCFKTC